MSAAPGEFVVLDHGTGAALSRELLEFTAGILGDVYVGEMEDSAVLPIEGGLIAMTTDSFVVDPPEFGNGDIGKVAVCGTVNDLAVSGAEPRYLTLAMILETGLSLGLLERVLTSVRDTAREAGVKIVAGDTKVVEAGAVDKIFLNTAGVGVFTARPQSMRDVRAGDRIIVSGALGNHTVHLLSIREGLGFETAVLSDCAPLNAMVAQVRQAVSPDDLHSMRDVTRGGLGAVLQEFAAATGHTVRVAEHLLPVDRAARMACDMLGIDPIHCANEGCVALFVAPEAEQAVLDALHAHPYGVRAVAIGEVTDEPQPRVELVDADGRSRTLEELRGAELPRLC